MNDSVTGLISLWMLLQLAVLLMMLLGGLYVLYCLNRAATGMERMAAAIEFWVQHDAHREAQREAQRATENAASSGTPSWMQPIDVGPPMTPTPPTPPAPPTEEKRDQL
jgi:hypothetical protein